MKIFKDQNLLEFAEHFKTDLDCKEYLGQIKWKTALFDVDSTMTKKGPKSYSVDSVFVIERVKK